MADGGVDWCQLMGTEEPFSTVISEGFSVFTLEDGRYMGLLAVNVDSYLQWGWYVFSGNGELEFVKTSLKPNGTRLYFVIKERAGQFYCTYHSSEIPHRDMFIEKFDPDDGPEISCLETSVLPLITNDLVISPSDLTFSLSANTVHLTPSTINESPPDIPIVKIPFCTVATSCPETCNNGLDDDDDGYVDCYDEDCVCFKGTDCNGQFSEPSPIKAKIDWRTPVDYVSDSSTPLVANLNPQLDSLPEVILMEGNLEPGAGFYVDKMLIFQGDGSNAGSPDELNTDGLFFPTPFPPLGM